MGCPLPSPGPVRERTPIHVFTQEEFKGGKSSYQELKHKEQFVVLSNDLLELNNARVVELAQ